MPNELSRNADAAAADFRAYQAACTQAALFDFSARGKVELTGPEAAPFLHNLCTNDIKKLQPGMGCEAFLATAKGRLVAPLFVSRIKWFGRDSLVLDTAPGLGEKLCAHLTRFRISENVEITDRTRESALNHLCGPAAGKILEKTSSDPLNNLPNLHLVELPFRGIAPVFVRRNDLLHLPGFDLICDATNAEALRAEILQAGATCADEQAFEILRVEAGVPAWGKDVDEDRLVMEINRTAQGISFNKGCYLGQETIVMARDRGHVNRALLGLRLNQLDPVPAGAKVLHEKEELGQVTSSVFSPRLGTAIALAYLKRGWHTPGTSVLVDTGTETIAAEVRSLPFLPS